MLSSSGSIGLADVPFRPSGLAEEEGQRERHRQRYDSQEDSVDPTVDHQIAEDRGAQPSQQHSHDKIAERHGMGVAKVNRENAVGISSNTEEEGLPERQHPAVAPHQAEAERHEHSVEKILSRAFQPGRLPLVRLRSRLLTSVHTHTTAPT
jgi:hypothetical protein